MQDTAEDCMERRGLNPNATVFVPPVVVDQVPLSPLASPSPPVQEMSDYDTGFQIGIVTRLEDVYGDQPTCDSNLMAVVPKMASKIFWWWRRRRVDLRVRGRRLVKVVADTIASLEADDVQGVTCDEVAEQHVMVLRKAFPMITEDEEDFAERLFRFLWSKLVSKGILVDVGVDTGYFVVHCNSAPRSYAPGLLGLS